MERAVFMLHPLQDPQRKSQNDHKGGNCAGSQDVLPDPSANPHEDVQHTASHQGNQADGTQNINHGVKHVEQAFECHTISSSLKIPVSKGFPF